MHGGAGCLRNVAYFQKAFFIIDKSAILEITMLPMPKILSIITFGVPGCSAISKAM